RKGSGPSYYAIYEARSTVGTVTEISNQINSFFATLAKRTCLECGSEMKKAEQWSCLECDSIAPLPSPRDFSPITYSAACGACSGVGHINHLATEKLIIAPDKPLCAGAMHSPGYYPGKYFCEPTSAASGMLVALGGKYGFDPKTTPWDEISPEGQHAFLYGDEEKLEFSYLGTQRGKRTKVTGKNAWWGFYKLVRNWDIGQTFTTRKTCEKCGGAGLKVEFLTYTLEGFNVDELQRMTISSLREVLAPLQVPDSDPYYAKENHFKTIKRLKFLEKVGLGYLHLNRKTVSLSAGEAQRIALAGLLGSGLTSLTILLDEPTRGMHPSEVDTLVEALQELRAEGNSVIIVEHDPVIIQAADELIDMGPSAGTKGGKIVARGTPDAVMSKNTITAQWLKGNRKVVIPENRRDSIAWMDIKGAKGNNLKNLDVEIPLGVLVGFCGVSGSGKSTLLVDTLGRALAPKKLTTSVAYEEIEPEEYESITGMPERIVMLDQVKRNIRHPGNALGIMNDLISIYAESEDANSKGIEKDFFSKACSVCKGAGRIRTELGFLPNVYSECETCNGSGRTAEAWDIKVKGYALPELNDLTLGEIYELFKDDGRIERKVRPALEVGLEYLVLRQPSRTLSGGEVQRLKIAQELAKKNKQGTLFIVDEPSVGQHLEDVDRLIDVLHRLVADGNSVFVVEHHPHILAACDWIVELGPKGGPDGGYVIAEGTPETVADMNTPTAPYIKGILEGGI
ncbi:MAG: ATP-binding cassette domain-containing protein, partial [Candidatus Thorarchaeota archaeon]